MKKNQPQPNASRAFDDALPEHLVHLDAVSDQTNKVPIHAGETELSPFIVKLTRGSEDFHARAQITSEQTVVGDSVLTDPIAALAQSFIIEHDDVLDEAPLAIASTTDDGLLVTIQDVKDQSLETDRLAVTAGMNFKVPTLAAANLHGDHIDVAVPVDIWSETHPIDVVQEFLPTNLEVVQEHPEPELAVIDFSEVPVVIAESKMRLSVPRGQHWQRALASFVGLALAVVLPLHALQVMADAKADGGLAEAQSKAALATFLRGATSLNSEEFGSAGADFNQAAAGFAEAEASLNDLNAGVVALASVLPQTDKTVDSAHALVTAGRELSETAAVMSQAAHDLSDKHSLDLTSKLTLLGTYMENALPHAQTAAEAVLQIDRAVVPSEYVQAVTQLQYRTPQVAASMEEYVGFVDALGVMLGGEAKMRYLAVFQNNTELRPTGGFMGSFAEMDVDKGEVVRMLVPGGGTYDTQGQLQAFVAAPGPLQLLKARWEFQDANWFPDFPTSAKKLSWFYTESGGPTTDGVVAVNANFVADLLGVLGPVDMPEYGRTFNAENFVFETQKIVEMEYDKTENAPKEVIGDLAPILLDRIKNADVPTLLAVIDLVAKGLEQKDIQVHFRDNALQASAQGLGWTGDVKQTSGDYLMVVNTNLGGGKTDGVIDQDVRVDVQVKDNGSVENTVTITKTHRGMKTSLFTGNNNVDYLRVYVPRGSVLLSAQGFEIPADELFETTDLTLAIDEDLELHMQDLQKDPASGTDIWNEDGKTVFGNWMQTASGETEVVTFTYRTPMNVLDQAGHDDWLSGIKAKLGMPVLGHYTLLVQKQSGVENRQTTVNVSIPSQLKTLWGTVGDGASLTTSADNQTDAFFGWLFEQK